MVRKGRGRGQTPQKDQHQRDGVGDGQGQGQHQRPSEAQAQQLAQRRPRPQSQQTTVEAPHQQPAALGQRSTQGAHTQQSSQRQPEAEGQRLAWRAAQQEAAAWDQKSQQGSQMPQSVQHKQRAQGQRQAWGAEHQQPVNRGEGSHQERHVKQSAQHQQGTQSQQQAWENVQHQPAARSKGYQQGVLVKQSAQRQPGVKPEQQALGNMQHQQAETARGHGSQQNVNKRDTLQNQEEENSSLKPCRRPDDGGTLGRKIKLKVNHFKLELKGTKKAYHYDVEINENGRSMPNKALRRVTMHHVFSSAGFSKYFPSDSCVFDGMKSMYSCRKLNFQEHEFPVKITHEGREREFEVAIKKVAEVDLNNIATYIESGSTLNIPQSEIQCLDIVLRYHQTYNLQFVPVTRSLFSMEQLRLVELGDGAVVWFGHFQSVRMGSHMFLNVDTSQKAFYKSDNVLNVLYEVLNLDQNYDPPSLAQKQVKDFEKYIKGVKVRSQVGSYYRVNGLLSDASDQTFKFEFNGQNVTVEEYYRKKYQIELEYPYLPCLWVGTPGRVPKVVVPMELCTILPGQVMRGKLNETQTREMIKAATKPPADRKRRTEETAVAMDGGGAVAKNFGISVSNTMTQVDGRILDAPVVKFGNNQQEIPKDGKWDMRNKKFLYPAALESWGVLDVSGTRDDNKRRFFDKLERMARSYDMYVNDKCFTGQCRNVYRDVEADLRKYQKMNPKLNFVFVIISKKGDDIYRDIKFIGDLELSIGTQCITRQNVMKCDDSTIANILLKVNSKLGGTNTNLSINLRHEMSLPNMKEPVMIFGADVSHPGPEFRSDNPKPPIAAVVGSIDALGLKYCGEIRAQEPGREIIDDLEDIVVKLLRKYWENNPHIEPARLIFFRDGVSESQFQDVLKTEFNAIRKACLKIRPGYSPQITFIVVQKRHNTRFFAEPDQPTVGKNKNIPPGTVVDTVITHKQEFDFFICSHEGIQGTSRPTHYCVLFDENNFSSNHLQTLTYDMCHMYVRCARSVSNPAPSYYAHLLAFRGRHYSDSMIRRGIYSPRQQTEMLKKFSKTKPMSFI
ncbi:protein argonaute-2-like [Artemia franciscana]|uniref:protein argonaute-2-like n=1 Tax=Artemia franciscana TaxID=6661 RepID=UPI0032DB0CD2